MELGYCLVSPASSGYQAFLFRCRPLDGLHPLSVRDAGPGIMKEAELQRLPPDQLLEFYRLALDFGMDVARKAFCNTGRDGTSITPVTPLLPGATLSSDTHAVHEVADSTDVEHQRVRHLA